MTVPTAIAKCFLSFENFGSGCATEDCSSHMTFISVPLSQEFVAKTYRHDRHGLLDAKRTTHYEWGRWGYVGFAIKKQN